MELTIVFSEFSEEYGADIYIGEKFLGNVSEEVAHKEAKRIVKTLSEIRSEKINYLLQDENKNFLAELPK